jgi:hypothetical protein
MRRLIHPQGHLNSPKLFPERYSRWLHTIQDTLRLPSSKHNWRNPVFLEELELNVLEGIEHSKVSVPNHVEYFTLQDQAIVEDLTVVVNGQSQAVKTSNL